jgi:site-specific DNA-methyltransferase (cytosine-N4-specific)
MRKLLEKGTYTGGQRPSEHRIGERSFLQDNGGAIPGSVLVPPGAERYLEAVLPIANTVSRDRYRQMCKDNGLTPHPARMPEPLVSFFVKFLTDAGDLVLDPFSGSNTTGVVAEREGRRWLGVELNAEYAAGAAARFGEFADRSAA